jgi:hypothetical protein
MVASRDITIEAPVGVIGEIGDFLSVLFFWLQTLDPQITKPAGARRIMRIEDHRLHRLHLSGAGARHGGGDAIARRHGGFRVDHLAFAVDFPMPVFGAVVTDRSVAASLEPVGNEARVSTVEEPIGERF